MRQRRSRSRGWILAAAVVVLLVGGPVKAQDAPDQDPDLRPLFSGSALMYSLPTLTVVYPAGPDQDRERNRISAERRADYLRGRHGTETLVVADVDFDEQHRDDNLLVLGWHNRVALESSGVEMKAKVWSFAGIEHGFDHDLLFGWVSPFDPAKVYLFWSRIEPELDRYLVLPFFGSDWVVFDDYYVLRYGRFDKNNPNWPPQRKQDVEVDNRPRRRRPQFIRASEHYELYYFGGPTPEETARILASREEAWKAATAILGSPEAGSKIRLYVYRDSEQKEEVSFVHDARHHMPGAGELHLTKVIAMDPTPHEDTHLIARRLFGPGYLTALVEGVAVWVEQQGSENELPVYANMMLSKGAAPSVGDLLDEETMRVLMRNRMGFPFAGLFVSWLHDAFGLDGIRRVFNLYASDPAALAGKIGIEPERLEAAFGAYLRAQSELGRDEATFRAAQGKAQHFTGLGDYERAAPALEEALKIRPNHLLTRYDLALVHKELGRWEAAAKQLRTLLGAPQIQQEAELGAWAWLQLGEVYDRLGDPEKAGRAYRKVLELPDHRDVHALARLALDEPAGSDGD